MHAVCLAVMAVLAEYICIQVEMNESIEVSTPAATPSKARPHRTAAMS